MEAEFDQKVALVTGAASGIGRATALAFAAAGAAVVVSDLNAEQGQETVQQIQNAGGEATFVESDVSNPKIVEALVAQAINTYGQLDFGVNNAGIGGAWSQVAEYDLAEWDRIIAINLNGVFYCMQAELKQMLQQGSGAIVNTASVAGLRGLANSAAYSASKHGVIGLTKSAALEYARNNIRINAVCPVFTRTPLFEKMFKLGNNYEERLKRNIPMRRYGEPEDIAAAILWLCSERASFVTGQAITLDGGYTAS